jgi:hypothetical protein
LLAALISGFLAGPSSRFNKNSRASNLGYVGRIAILVAEKSRKDGRSPGDVPGLRYPIADERVSGIGDSARLAGGEDFRGHPGEAADCDKVGAIGGIEAEGLRYRDAPGVLAGAHPFVHGGGQGDPEASGEVLAEAEQFKVAASLHLEAIGDRELESLRGDCEQWSGRRDSNPRPPRPERGALPDCATPRLHWGARLMPGDVR